MPRGINRLSARSVATTSQKGLYGDGGGLWLQVSSTGTKSWLYRYTIAGRAREMGLGSLGSVSLAKAREHRALCKRQIQDGIDPIDARRSQRSRAKSDSAKSMTFRACAETYIETQEAGWRNAKHASQWRNTLKTYAYPIIGELPVEAIDIEMVLEVLNPIWKTKTETASRVRSRIEQVIDWAAVHGYRTGENPARWKGHLDKTLPARSKVQKVRHHPALPYEQMGEFMALLRSQKGVGARGLEFQILTAARTGEVIGATWDEINLDAKVWALPGERVKSGSDHRVPLSTAAMEVVRNMKEKGEDGFVFLGAREGKPLSNMAFLQVLKRMERSDITAHGFRSTFRDWAADQTSFSREVAEKALAHAISDKVEAAYRRRDLFDKRRNLMEAWAVFCAGRAAESSANPVDSNGDK